MTANPGNNQIIIDIAYGEKIKFRFGEINSKFFRRRDVRF